RARIGFELLLGGRELALLPVVELRESPAQRGLGYSGTLARPGDQLRVHVDPNDHEPILSRLGRLDYRRLRKRAISPGGSRPSASAARISPSSGPNLKPWPDVPHPITTLPRRSMTKSSSGVLS